MKNLELDELTELFSKLGANDPESWAASQINEGINQLGRFLFLRQAWKLVVDEHDTSWIDKEIRESERYPNAPCSGIGIALKNLLADGADKQDITDVVRGMQYDLLFHLCYLLDYPGELEAEVKDISWGLMQLDENGEIVAPITALDESLLGTDPTGREMRPRDRAKK